MLIKKIEMKTAAPCCLALWLLISCTPKRSVEQENEEVKINEKENIVRVDTINLQPSVFSANIISNGKIRAAEYVDLYFRNSELVEEVMVRNGQHVKKGDILAKLDLYKLNNTLKQQKNDIEQARLEMQDVIIGQGYDPEKMNEVPEDVKHLAAMRSGLDKAEASYNSTIRDIEEASLKAPFSGVVANVEVQRHAMAKTSEPAMRIINDGTMNIEFPVLDTEVGMIKTGDEVEVIPFAGTETYKGRITEINPIVEENGQIKVKASIDRSQGLIDGLNARVKVNRQLNRALVVPKSAVVLRTGRQVAFTYRDGKALWTYVTTGLENMDSYVIDDGLEAGQAVIVSGNENLAHESPVEIAK